jgi:sugar lactone lactonase YvrE
MNRFVTIALAAAIFSWRPAGAGEVLYVSNYDADSVSSITANGTVGLFAAPVNLPGQIAVDAQGNLYVGNGLSSNTITKIGASGAPSIFASGINGVGGIVLDKQGFFYVAASYSDQIYKLSTDGVLSSTPFATLASGSRPQFLALDQAGNLYTSNAFGGASTGGTIDKITPDGTVTPFAAKIDRPEGIAFDRQGNLYVASYTDNSIIKISADGNTRSTFASGLTGGPDPIAFDNSGNLFVGAGQTTIYEISPSGAVSTFVSDDRLSLPNGLAFAPQTVPEPSTLILCSLGLAGLFGILRAAGRQSPTSRGSSSNCRESDGP